MINDVGENYNLEDAGFRAAYAVTSVPCHETHEQKKWLEDGV